MALNAEQLLQMAAGERCGCGHHVRSHEPPIGQLDGERCGRCKVRTCDCQGMFEVEDDEIKENAT